MFGGNEAEMAVWIVLAILVIIGRIIIKALKTNKK